MKHFLLFLLLFPFFVFSQSEVKTEYWDNGKILSQVHYKNGVREGSCRYYYKNGITKDTNVAPTKPVIKSVNKGLSDVLSLRVIIK